jgi:PAS domain S-box-containing protein
LLRGGEVAHVVEIASDISELLDLQNRLREARDYYESLIRNAATGILAVDTDGSVRIMNPAARAVLGWKQPHSPGAKLLHQLLPEDFFAEFDEPGRALEHRETTVRTTEGRQVPVRFTAVELGRRGRVLGRAAFFEDLSEVKRLEQEKLEAERLGVVGQTVAGLAHTIKNLLMGLEGGMYMVDSGLRQGNADRIAHGWEMLQRNFEKTTALVKDFLSFAKGRLPQLRPTDPNEIAGGVVALYRDAAARQGVELVFEAGENVREAPLDPQGMETCLTNLISNAIDAAVMREDEGGRVVLRTAARNGDLVFEVLDNGCGMDWEVKGKVFTTFFTTKGGHGTGLGLLTTRKIVQEHGGWIDVESTPGEGSLFRIRLPRKRLETLQKEAPKT